MVYKFVFLSAHRRIAGDQSSQDVLAEALRLLAERYQITHATLQLEDEKGTVCLGDTCQGA